MTFFLEPVTRDNRGKFVSDFSYKTGDFYTQIAEAMMIAHENAIYIDFLADRNADDRRLKEEAQDELLELIGLMTTVATRIQYLVDEHGYSAGDLAEMQKSVIEINRDCGYFEKPTK